MLKSFCEQTSPLAVVPNNLKKITTAAPKNVEIARVGITRQRLLHKQGKRAESLSHIRVAGRQPDVNATWKSDHL
jgi:hypothetical protein